MRSSYRKLDYLLAFVPELVLLNLDQVSCICVDVRPVHSSVYNNPGIRRDHRMSFEACGTACVDSVVAAGAVSASITVEIAVSVAACTSLAIKLGIVSGARRCLVAFSACEALKSLEHLPIAMVTSGARRAVLQVVLPSL